MFRTPCTALPPGQMAAVWPISRLPRIVNMHVKGWNIVRVRWCWRVRVPSAILCTRITRSDYSVWHFCTFHGSVLAPWERGDSNPFVAGVTIPTTYRVRDVDTGTRSTHMQSTHPSVDRRSRNLMIAPALLDQGHESTSIAVLTVRVENASRRRVFGCLFLLRWWPCILGFA